MADDSRHVFRFFVDALGEAGATVELSEFDRRHARVLHGAQTGVAVDVVDAAGVVWRGSFDGPTGRVVLASALEEVAEPSIELLAVVTVGGRTDELVDAAVQAGATRIVPVVRSERDRAKVAARAERLERIATSAAKQAKRGAVPVVGAPMLAEQLDEFEPGVVVDPAAEATLDDVLAAGAPMRLLVGSSDGFPDGLVDQLAAAGWQRARLGPTILRTELAVGVAVALASMHAARP